MSNALFFLNTDPLPSRSSVSFFHIYILADHSHYFSAVWNEQVRHTAAVCIMKELLL